MVERKRFNNLPAVLGRPPLQWDDETREWVRVMAGFGLSHAEIGRAIKPSCSPPVLRENFRQELDEGGSEVKGRISRMAMTCLEGRPVEHLINQKTGKPVYDPNGNPVVLREELKPSPVMIIFLCKVRLGLKEDNVPDQAKPEVTLDLTKLNVDELRIFERLLEKVMPTVQYESVGRGEGVPEPTQH